MGPASTQPGRAADPFRFALGHVRSGTTMLRALLDSHSALAVPPESYFVVPALSTAVATGAPYDPDAFVARVRRDRYFADWDLDDAELDALRHDPRVHSTADAIAGLYATYARVRGKPHYADKTPSHLLDVDLLAQQFPAGRFLHQVRDGRDVVASVLTMDFGPAAFADAAWAWRRRVLKAHRVGRALGPERYLEIHYEDLVADPEPVLRRVCTFFGLDYEPEMLRYHERADDLLSGLRDTAHLQGIRRPPTQGVRDWRVDLTPTQIRVFDEVAGDALDVLGYERSGLARSWRARASAVETTVRCEARRRWRKTKGRTRSIYRRVFA
jgi:hypothetical protein